MLFDKMQSTIGFIPCLNTSTLFDIATGKFHPGINNKWYLNGGLYLTTGIMGRGQTFKSGEAGSLMVRAMLNYPKVEGVVYESEFNIPDEYRYDDFVPYGQPKVSPRIIFINPTNMALDEFFDQMYDIAKEKEKNKKDYYVDSPFLNIKTLKPHKIWMPTLVQIDSFSKARGKSTNDKFEDTGVDSADMNTMYMKDGMLKTRIMEQLPNLAAKYGIYFILTAHVDNQIQMDPRAHPSKELQYMKQTDKIKNVGSKFTFLTTTLLQTLGATVLMDSTKTNSYYPAPGDGVSLTEVNEVNNVVVRCKNNASGNPIPFIVSQYQGILNEVTNFHYIRKMKDYGMTVSGRNNYTLDLYKEKSIHRNTIRKITEESYEIRRALELTAQLCFIQHNWYTANLPKSISTPISTFAEKLSNNKKPSISDVLNSTSNWSIGKSERPYMSIFEIADIVANAT